MDTFARCRTACTTGSLAMALLLGGLSSPIPTFAQPCPTFSYTNPRDIDPQWPSAYYNKFQQMPNRVDADSSRGCVQVPPGFSAHLWASEKPHQGGVRAPLAIAFDERGRVWVAESFDYPHNLNAGFTGTDRIVILEDRNGDGMADTLKVFAENLNLVTGLVHTVDGLVVAMAPHLLLFKDEDGDDVADSAGRILYTGFSRIDTHGSLSNLMYGLDNWVYGMMGYNSSTVGGTQYQGSIWRARSDGSAIQRLTPSSAENTWGLGMTETGQFFYGRANRDHSRHMVYPGNVASAVVRIPNYPCAAAPAEVPPVPANQVYSCPKPVTTHWHINNPGYSSSSNQSIYTARHFPEKYWDRAAFVCEAPRHLCHTMYLRKNGSTWTGFEDSSGVASAYNVFASTDAWTAPIQAHTGPDGAVWVVDWYNYLLSHNWHQPKGGGDAQISAIRDNQHSRIYRVRYDGRPLDAILDLSKANEDQLVEALHHPNLLWRLHAQRLLVKRGTNPGLVTKLSARLSIRSVDALGETPVVIHALRTLEGLGHFAADPATWVPVLKDLLLHPSPGVRWNALDAMPAQASSTTAILEQGRINDPDAHVRLRALHKLSTLPGTKSGAVYAPYVSLDAHSQNRYNAVGGLTTTQTMPAIPALHPVVPIARGAVAPAPFAHPVTASYRAGFIEMRGGDAAGAAGELTIRDARGGLVGRVRVADGRSVEAVRLPRGVYAFGFAPDGGAASRTGRFSVLE